MGKTSDGYRATHQEEERNFFAMVPRIVWAYSRDPFDLSFWIAIRDIAGENGQCTLDTQELAALAMMSAGKAAECRAYLMEAGLLAGELRKDPGHHKAIWHLSIPNGLWARSNEWALNHTKLRDRVAWKEAQREEVKTGRKNERSSDERSSDERSSDERSCGDSKEKVIYNLFSTTTVVKEKPTTARARRAPKEAKPLKDPHLRHSKLNRSGRIPEGEGQNPVEVFYERFSFEEFKLTSGQRDQYLTEVTDLNLWRRVLAGYDMSGYNPRNAGLLLKWYANGITAKEQWTWFERKGKGNHAETSTPAGSGGESSTPATVNGGRARLANEAEIEL